MGILSRANKSRTQDFDTNSNGVSSEHHDDKRAGEARVRLFTPRIFAMALIVVCHLRCSYSLCVHSG